ncbi:taste receptor type 1 member 2 isoform X3 [Cricetulus griseus]|uniref:Taste receptor type 1 member 2 isoform X3 n=1 Tax=Cricetulus griseus TaxID=10029 RepID=A0A9J7GV84_CRIGR|nr:taste receptor type 1 member 2 isoform X3 [Cricetulus griseus]
MWLSERSEFIPNYKCKTQHKALGIIAGIRPEFSAAIGTLLELYKIPQVTYGLFHSVLSDKDTFPSVYQISPQEKGLTQGVICLLLHFGWKWVGLIVADDIHGREFLSDLTAELASEDICVAFTEKIPTFMKVDFYFGVGLVNLSQHTKVNVRVFYGDIDDVLIFYIQNEIISKRKKMWIMAKPRIVYLQSVFYKWIGLISFLVGSFSFSKKRNIPGFKHFIEALTPSQYPSDIYFHKFWLDNFHCSPSPLLCGVQELCPLNISLKNKQEIQVVMITSEPSVSIWNAVYAVAHALHEILLSKTEIDSHKDINQDRLLPWQLHPFLRKIQFTNAAGDQICFDEKKNPMEKILNLYVQRAVVLVSGNLQKKEDLPAVFLVCFVQRGTFPTRQVTYGLFHSVLSDKDTFQSLYQISPQEKALTKGVIFLLLHFGWKWVGLIVADDLNGKEFLSDLTAELASEDICVAFTEKIPTFKKNGFSVLGWGGEFEPTYKSKLHVFYGDIDDVLIFYILNEIKSKTKKMWIMAKPNFVYLQSVFYKWIGLMSFFEGRYSLSKKRNIPGFKHFVQALTPSHYPSSIYFHKFWLDNFHCSPSPLLCGVQELCPLNISLKNKQEIQVVMITSEPSVSILNAVYAVAHALHEMLLSKTKIDSHKDINQDRLLPWQLSSCSVDAIFL